MLSLAQRSFELCGSHADESIVRSVLDVDQLTKLVGRLLAAGRYFFQQSLGIVVVLGGSVTSAVGSATSRKLFA